MNPVEKASPTFYYPNIKDEEVMPRLRAVVIRNELLPSRLAQTIHWAGKPVTVTSSHGEMMDAMALMKRTTLKVWELHQHFQKFHTLNVQHKVGLLECEKELETLAAFVNEPAHY